VITLHIPPLRQRKEDIPLLVDHFLGKYSHETTKYVDQVNRRGLDFLKSYDWPGNVRELENAVERAVVLSKSRTLSSTDFSFLVPAVEPVFKPRSIRDVEKMHIEQVLIDCNWNITHAARILDINRATLHRMINRYALQRPTEN